MNYVVIDLETTVHNTIGTNKASAFCPDNRIVLAGVKSKNSKGPIILREPWFTGTEDLYVGHNIGFDIHHILKTKYPFKDNWHKRFIWDTQLAEYLLSGQTSIMPSLDDLSLKYGGKLKDNRLSVMWEAGMDTEEIPEEILEEYLEGDVINTELVFLKQIELASELEMMPFIVSQMKAKMACIEMEYNGMHIDREKLNTKALHTDAQLSFINGALRSVVDKLKFPHEHLGEFDPNKRSHISAVLFGTTYKYKVKAEDSKKKEEVTALFKGFEQMAYADWKQGKGNMYNVSEEVLKIVKAHASDVDVVAFIDLLLEHRKLSKEKSTYLDGIKEKIFPDGNIHHNLNQEITRTGRLSSSNPNLQNITDSHIKEIFTSRSPTGLIIDADYSQIEIYALAYLSRDPQLNKDLNDGLDIHTELYKSMYHGKLPSDKERKQFKRLSFGLIYGAGPSSLAANSGVSKEEATRFIKVFYSRYKQVEEYHRGLLIKATHYALNQGDKTELGMPALVYKAHMHTGRILTYKQYDNKWTKNPSFSITELKNYPVQSFATGDIVPLVLGRLFQEIKNHPILKDKLLMINTVHDSIMFDLLDETYLLDSVTLIKSVMEQAPTFLKETFDIDLGLSLTTTITAGKNWFEMEEVK